MAPKHRAPDFTPLADTATKYETLGPDTITYPGPDGVPRVAHVNVERLQALTAWSGPGGAVYHMSPDGSVTDTKPEPESEPDVVELARRIADIINQLGTIEKIVPDGQPWNALVDGIARLDTVHAALVRLSRDNAA